jgi:hypothetical protein
MFQDVSAFSSYSVDDIVAAKTFYQDVLGCTVSEDEMGLHLSFKNGHTVYIYQKDDHVPATFTVLNFSVTSVDETIERLSERGITMERYDTLPAPLDEKGVLRGKAAGIGPDIAWFTDPARNVIAIMAG